MRVLVGRLLIILFLLLASGLFCADSQARKILFIHSYHPGFAWTDNINKSAIATLRASFPKAKIYIEYMDTKRHLPRNLNQQLFDLYYKKYRKLKPDVLLSSDDNAFNFLLRYRKRLFPGVPFVFCGVNRFEKSMLRGQQGVSGVVEAYDLKTLTETVLTIHGELKNLVVVNDGTPSGITHKKNFEKIAPLFSKWVNIIRLYDMTKKDLQAKLRNLPANSAVLLFSLYRTKDGVLFTNKEIGKFMVANCKAPFYSAWDSMLNAKVVGGYMVSSSQQGKKAAEIATQILKYSKRNKYSVVLKSPNQLLFDYKMLQHYKISTSLLPVDSVVLGKPESFYEKYGSLIWSALIILLVQSAMLIALSINVARRKKAEQTMVELNRVLEERVEERTSALRESLGDLKRAQNRLIESEKMASLGTLVSGVAHEINTPIGVCITAASFLQDAIASFKKRVQDDTIDTEYMQNFVRSAVDSSAMVVMNLRRAAELVKSFKQLAVDQYAEEKRSFNVYSYFSEVLLSLRPRLRKSKLVLNLDCDKQYTIFSYPSVFAHIITILVLNSVTHGYEEDESGVITIKVSINDGNCVFMYTDDGSGIAAAHLARIFEPFYTTKMSQYCAGLGLNIAYNLVTQKLDGRISCESEQGGGVNFRIVFPVQLV